MINVPMFLTPKQELCYVFNNVSIKTCLDKLKTHKFVEIIVLNKDGEYVGILNGKDLLISLEYDERVNFDTYGSVKLSTVDFSSSFKCINIDTPEDELSDAAIKQNITPVVDSGNRFIGIIRRADLLEYYYKKYFNK